MTSEIWLISRLRPRYTRLHISKRERKWNVRYRRWHEQRKLPPEWNTKKVSNLTRLNVSTQTVESYDSHVNLSNLRWKWHIDKRGWLLQKTEQQTSASFVTQTQRSRSFVWCVGENVFRFTRTWAQSFKWTWTAYLALKSGSRQR